MSMDPFALSQSPRTQGFQQPQGQQDEDDLFTQGFTELARNAFAKTHPELLDMLLTFRVLSTDASAGEGLGAFILRAANDVLFIPAVIVDNTIKPLEMFYTRVKDRFYPLTAEWLQTATAGVSTMGDGVEPPKTLTTDVDLRNQMLPPTTGRYSYAEDYSDPAWSPFTAAKVAEVSDGAPPVVFPELLSKMANHQKVALARYFQQCVPYFRKLAEVYGAKNLISALQLTEEKTAAGIHTEMPIKRDVYLVTASTDRQEIKKELGDDGAKEAYKAVRYHGFYLKDRRDGMRDSVVSMPEELVGLTTPDAPGVYMVFLVDGTAEKALIIPDPICVSPAQTDNQRMARDSHKSLKEDGYKEGPRYLVLMSGGRGGCLDRLVVEPVLSSSQEELEAFIDGITEKSPERRERGCLVSTANLTFRATDIFYAEDVNVSDDQVTINTGYRAKIIMSRKLGGGRVIKPTGASALIFPNSFRWLKVTEDLRDGDLLDSQRAVMQMLEQGVKRKGLKKIEVKTASNGAYVVGRQGWSSDNKIEAIVKVATTYNLGLKDAAEIVEITRTGVPVRAWAEKTAAEGAAPQPSEEPMMDPSMVAPAPPPPTGMELAIQEKLTQVASQRAALDQAEQMLNEILGRSQGIDAGGGAMAAPGAAAAMAGGPSQGVMGQPAMAPVPGLTSDPGMQQGAPPPAQGAPQGAPPADPSMQPQPGTVSGMQPPAMDPSMGGDPAMQGDPSMQQPEQPPMPVMPKDPNPALFDQQINPAFLDQAAELDNQGVFDATAVASLASVRSVRDLLQNYTPTLDNALDRLGRTLLLLYVKSRMIQDQIGAEAYTRIEQTIRDVFRMLGDALLELNQYGDSLTPNGARAA